MAGSPSRTGYWRFIDGLRAIAVLSVVLYHAGTAQMPGGFVGVDIFFVISGYLIINQIVFGKKAGRFSFSEFWSRRALRILPPYLLVILVCAAIAPFVLVLPVELEAFANEVGASALMVVNHLFLEQQGYFDRGADTKVLLHLWSLAVEEQFYLVAPVLITILWATPGRLFAAAGVILFGASLAGCIYWTGGAGDKNYAFFLMVLRAWEFIAGGAMAAVSVHLSRLPRVAIEAISVAGVAAIIYAVTAFDAQSMPFPSYWAAIPVFGACAIIASGLAGPSFVKSALSIAPMTAIGLISYSWYLWHWPLLVFARIYNFGDLTLTLSASMVAMSLALAIGTYFLVERPIRHAREVRGLPLGWLPTLAGLSACLLVCLAGYNTFINRAQAASVLLTNDIFPTSRPIPKQCNLALTTDPKACASGRPVGLLLGDSHAAAAASGLMSWADQHGVSLMVLASGGCSSLITSKNNIPDSQMLATCRDGRAHAKELLPQVRPEFAILYSRWPIYSWTGTGYFLADNEGNALKDQEGAFIEEFSRTTRYLRSLGVGNILVIGASPMMPRPAPECVARANYYGLNLDLKCSVPRSSANNTSWVARQWLRRATEGMDDMRVFDPLPAFCDASVCRPSNGSSVLFVDTNHLSNAGTNALIKGGKADFDWLLSDAP